MGILVYFFLVLDGGVGTANQATGFDATGVVVGVVVFLNDSAIDPTACLGTEGRGNNPQMY